MSLLFKLFRIKLILHLFHFNNSLDHIFILLFCHFYCLFLLSVLYKIVSVDCSMHLREFVFSGFKNLSMTFIIKFSLIIEHVSFVLFSQFIIECLLLSLFNLSSKNLISLLDFSFMRLTFLCFN